MRLFLLPISTRRTLLYAQKIHVVPSEKQTIADKVIVRATKLWAGWEKKESGWQRKVVDYGNYALRRIPYEEWGLKSVPPLSTRRREEETVGNYKAQLIYPDSVIPTTKALQVLHTLGTEREKLHRTRLIWSLIGMPISAPFALVPVVPNLPFFYLVYRAWSHWRALAGGKHIQFLIANTLLSLAPNQTLSSVYPPLLKEGTDTAPGKDKEELLITQAKGRELVKALEIPELEVELERAIWQVENAINEKHQESGAQQVVPHPKEKPNDNKNS
ncbi:mitochondrial K+-H+ exchange-related-domain-containing protein [Microdochium trichocladiopsis]|uniref:Mitochondrial K+-H+ exchange-related-domain-containing protein n=1 Tax=Microdochium trichocladiopsis TaxID=1682393 RepID=A0A9P9BT12_9PEZI|nr:mitochondrial K+-H+ exchange-related-domain-containing protein [Microdochium trichocladiopsis]KAH7035445.1 mitochondrial K+-H+ exchange-related-domain-containing protein [Microdochium trichocladiopsis]